MLNDEDVETSEHHNTFPIAQSLDILPSFACYDVDIIVSGDNDGDADNSLNPKDILPKAKIIIDSPATNVLPMFKCKAIFVFIYPNSTLLWKDWFTFCDFAYQSTSACQRE